jgi:hypothetical protein
VGLSEHAGFAFGALITPGRNLAGVVLAVTGSRIALLDPGTGELFAQHPWQSVLRFGVRHHGDFQTAQIVAYDGETELAERLRSEIPLGADEVSGAFLYLHASLSILKEIKDCISRSAPTDDISDISNNRELR